MIVASWNVQRLSPNSSLLKRTLAHDGLNRLMNVHNCDIIFLCEVSQLGHQLIVQGQIQLLANQPLGGYRAEFIENGNAVGGVSPCSYMVLTSGQLIPDITAIGLTPLRPFLRVEFGGCNIGCVHGRSAGFVTTAGEIQDFLTDLHGLGNEALIGDLNIDCGSNLAENVTAPGTGLEQWTKVCPGYDTWNNQNTLDFIYHRNANNCQSLLENDPIGNQYNSWGSIDHAPVAFDLDW